MAERRYDDEEVRAIFRVATEGQSNLPARETPREDGLSLADLQDIGKEVGIAPEAVAEAARTLDTRITAPAPARKIFGLPLAVSRTVELNRRVTDEEWERLVVQLRDVFQARGRLRSDGTLKQWTNGNLHVLLEPGANGHRLRLGTLNGTARSFMMMGSAMIFISLSIVVAAALGVSSADASRSILMLALGGSGLIAAGALRLPGWARLRSQQMEMLARQMANPNSEPPALPPPED
jgi:hypothetical protein